MIIDRIRIFFDIDYVSGKEYWIPFGEIKIKEEFYAIPPKYFKYRRTILGAIATIIASNKSGGLIRLINFINNSPFLATVEFNREVCELIV